MGAYTHVHRYAIKSNEMCCIENIFTNLQTFRYVRDWTTKWTTKIKVIQTDKSADNRKWQYFCLIKWGSININSIIISRALSQILTAYCRRPGTHRQQKQHLPSQDACSLCRSVSLPPPWHQQSCRLGKKQTNMHACLVTAEWLTRQDAAVLTVRTLTCLPQQLTMMSTASPPHWKSHSSDLSSEIRNKLWPHSEAQPQSTHLTFPVDSHTSSC